MPYDAMLSTGWQSVEDRPLFTKEVKIPKYFSLYNFAELPTIAMDSKCYLFPDDQAEKLCRNASENNHILEIHPIWLNQRGTKNHRGPYIKVLTKLLSL